MYVLLLPFQVTASSALQIRNFRLFHDAVNDERFDHKHLYDTEDGFQKTILSLAIEQWENPGTDNKFVALLLAYGSSLDEVDPATELAPIHAIVRKGSSELVGVALGASKLDKVDVNVQDGEGLTPLHTAVELLQVLRARITVISLY